MTTMKNGKYHASAVAAMHLDTARSHREHASGPMVGIVYRADNSKSIARLALDRARKARTQAGIYAAGDFHAAVLP